MQDFDPDYEDNLQDLSDLVDNEFSHVAGEIHSLEKIKVKELKEFKDFSKHVVMPPDMLTVGQV